MNKNVYILLATYNGEKYLKEQLDSILNQTYTNWILWIHDDNSQDSTVAIVKEYRGRFPQKIIYIDDAISTGGAKENFSFLLNHIDTEFDYLMFSDQDDVWLPDKIELFVNKMHEAEIKYSELPLLVFSDLKVVDSNLTTISDSMVDSQKLNPSIANYLHFLKCGNVITGCAMMINKKAYEVSIPIPKNALMHDWWVGIVVSKYGKNIYLDKQTILYRQHESNSIGYKKFSFLKVLKKILSVEIYKDYLQIKTMLTHLNLELSFTSYLSCKLRLIFLRVFKCRNLTPP